MSRSTNRQHTRGFKIFPPRPSGAGFLMVILLSCTLFGCGGRGSSSGSTPAGSAPSGGEVSQGTITVKLLRRPTLVENLSADEQGSAAPALAPYADGSSSERATAQTNPYGSVETPQLASDLSNVTNLDQFYFTNEQMDLLARNHFVVQSGGRNNEFYEIYEHNRYSLVTNFVTVDSIMHTYHLYFSHLLKGCEKRELSAAIATMSKELFDESVAQLSAVAGSEWEEAAQRNVAFFAVACELMGEDVEVPKELTDIVDAEVHHILAAQDIQDSMLTGAKEDYSQYKPRGYYAGDEALEQYFRTMMWYGRTNFAQKDESLDRSALLMTLALHTDDHAAGQVGIDANWEAVYTLTSFFAGASDDCGFYEYWPLVQEAYGDSVTAASLVGNDDAWQTFHALTDQVEAPKINSVVVDDTGTDTDHEQEEKGFRLMGQRFSLDAYIFTQLMYNKVGENSAGDTRLLPDALDMPAALGSDEALAILDEQGATDYAGYTDNMNALRTEIAGSAETLWTGSLYAQWLYTLNPLLVSKGEGYPVFMQNQAWDRKNLQTFLTSYTELKHDTVLYTKQAMAEMGGGPEESDDRGYVEPEPEVYTRLAKLTRATSEGLARYGMLSEEDKKNLDILAQLAEQLSDISVKELSGQTLSDDEYELIRTYGGQLEHFWAETSEGAESPQELPAAIVTDIATDPNGYCLEVGTGMISEIYVVFPLDGELHIASGAVSSFYQFKQPLSHRLTDTEWRTMVRNGSDAPDPPSWTSLFAPSYEYD